MTDTLVTRAPSSSQTEILTYQDLVNRLLDGPFNQLTRDGRNARIAKRAVLRAYRDLQTMHQWSYLERRGQLTTVASQETGTVVYDHTGGSSERLVTLTGATFPTDAQYYSLLIGTRVYQIQQYLSSTTIQLREDTNPGADVAATAYTLFRSKFPAPVGLRRVSELVDMNTGTWLSGITNAAMIDYLATSYTPQYEVCFTVRNTGATIGGLDFELAPPPSVERTYDYAYEASCRPLLTEKEYAGSVTVNSGATTVTGTGTAFAAKHVGSIIRFSDGSVNHPTPPEGSIEGDNPYLAQRTIMSVASSTSLTIDSSLSAATTYTGVKYVISDPLDVEQFSMLSALERLSIAYFAEDIDRSPPEERRNWMGAFQSDLVRAKIADGQMLSSGWVPNRQSYNLRDWLIAEAG